jgi:hypothetical protein
MTRSQAELLRPVATHHQAARPAGRRPPILPTPHHTTEAHRRRPIRSDGPSLFEAPGPRWGFRRGRCGDIARLPGIAGRGAGATRRWNGSGQVKAAQGRIRLAVDNVWAMCRSTRFPRCTGWSVRQLVNGLRTSAREVATVAGHRWRGAQLGAGPGWEWNRRERRGTAPFAVSLERAASTRCGGRSGGS